MSSAIQNILHQTLGDVARSSKFEVFIRLTDLESDIAESDIMYAAKATSFPGKSHTPIDLKFKGRSIPVKGQTKYTQTWECTFYLSEDHSLKNAFELWIEALDQHNNYVDNLNGLKELQTKHKNGYVSSFDIYQENFDNDYKTAKYTLFNVYPIEVSPIQMAYESVATVQEFTVTFSYSHFKMDVIKGSKGNFIDEQIEKLESTANNFVDNNLKALGSAINQFTKDAIGNTQNELNTYGSGKTLDYKNKATTNNSAFKSPHGAGAPAMINTTIGN